MTRTTITIDESLLAEIKIEAARTGRSVSQVLADAFRQMVAHHGSISEHSQAVHLPTWPADGEGGLLPGVDVDNNAALRDYLDEIGEKSWP